MVVNGVKLLNPGLQNKGFFQKGISTYQKTVFTRFTQGINCYIFTRKHQKPTALCHTTHLLSGVIK